ncbi:bile acid:sodium symporter family protein [Insolitispirillum peregrinum]|uniref:Solute carrier family 10 (Sodium/bile acid cotransporter), member 7 n=1 Tax=Insolitispirillum peregrinum TaxID=80876 RepID=A0A1N7MZ90_9PROT|nr:bile acid:sodium symporter family protein [Insolitispirillum peregrinum]SIS91426.1 solute carrier family 10 (sodium/bile acid cotransporter), member 7 [Insolitispirillum peregrinum]
MRRFLPDLFTIGLLLCVLLASLFPAHGAFAHGFGIATDCAIALLFFLHGARLSRETVIAGLLHWRLHLLILAITFGVFPLLGLAIGLIPDSLLPHPLYLGILYLCVLPSTVQSSIAFTSIAGGNIPAAICSASASNILGMFITPLLVGLLFSLGQTAGGFSLDSLQTILLQLLVPFIAGQLLQPWVGGWIRARKKLLMPVDRGSILMVVYLAFSHAVIEGVWHQFSLENLAMIVLLDILLLLCVLGLTLIGSRALGFNRADQITILFCGSKKSLVSGVPMANAIFSSAMIGAVVLPIMLFHQIQLMACAWIAARYAARPAAE